MSKALNFLFAFHKIKAAMNQLGIEFTCYGSMLAAKTLAQNKMETNNTSYVLFHT